MKTKTLSNASESLSPSMPLQMTIKSKFRAITVQMKYMSKSLPVFSRKSLTLRLAPEITNLLILLNGIFSELGIQILFTISWEVGIFFIIIRATVPLTKCGMKSQMKDMVDGSVIKIINENKKTQNSAIVPHQSEQLRSKMTISIFTAKSAYTRHYFTSTFVGIRALAMIAPVIFLPIDPTALLESLDTLSAEPWRAFCSLFLQLSAFNSLLEVPCF